MRYVACIVYTVCTGYVGFDVEYGIRDGRVAVMIGVMEVGDGGRSLR